MVGISREELFDEAWFNNIVTVDKANKITSSLFQALISGGGLTLVFLVNDFNTLIFFGIVINYFFRVVSGTIID